MRAPLARDVGRAPARHPERSARGVCCGPVWMKRDGFLHHQHHHRVDDEDDEDFSLYDLQMHFLLDKLNGRDSAFSSLTKNKTFREESGHCLDGREEEELQWRKVLRKELSMPEEEKEHVQDYIAALRTQYSRELSDSQSAVETLRQENGELRQALMEARRDVILIQSELDRLRKVSENRTPPTWNHAFSTDALYRRMLGAVSGCVSSWSVALWSDRRPPERLGDTTGRCHRVQRRVLRYRSGQSESVLDLISSDHVVDGGDVGGQEDISEFRGGGSGGSGRRNTLNLRRRLFAFPSQSEDALLGGGQLCEPILRLVLVGDVGSGKSSFLLQLRHHRFTGDVQPTVGVDCYVKQMFVDGQMTTLQIWDTAGLERFSSVSRSYFRRADGILLLYDITSEKSFRSLPNWIAQIQECADAAVPLCLIGNKVDLRSELPESECVSSACGERLAMACGALFCETSAKDGTNVVEAVLHLARKVKLSSGMCRKSYLQLSLDAPSVSSCCWY